MKVFHKTEVFLKDGFPKKTLQLFHVLLNQIAVRFLCLELGTGCVLTWMTDYSESDEFG